MPDPTTDFLVIIPTFRRPEYLRAAIKGVLAQSGISKKIIVVDDSPEGSAEDVAESFGSDVIYRKTPEPTGGWPGRARNYGLHVAAEMGLEPSFVHFLDDDDIPFDGFYSTAKRVFNQHSDIGVVYGTLVPFCEFSTDAAQRKLQEEQLLKVREWHAHMAAISKIYGQLNAISGSLGQWFYRSQYLFSHELFLCSGAMIRYEHVKKLNGFDPNTRITEDYEFYTRAIVRFGLYFLGRPAVLYRVGNAGALWNPLALEGKAKSEHEAEVAQILKLRKSRLREEMGNLKFFSQKIAFRAILFALNKTLVGKLQKNEITRA